MEGVSFRQPISRPAFLAAGLGFVLLGAGSLGACVDPDSSGGGGSPAPTTARTAESDEYDDGLPVHGYEVVAVYPHDRRAFTQGLLYADGGLYESTGQRGESSLRFVELQTGQVQRMRRLPSQYFAEGLARIDRNLIQLTWTSGKVFIASMDSPRLDQVGEFQLGHQGWGAACDGTRLYISDGTPTVRVYEPRSMAPIGSFEVTAAGEPLRNLNELELIDGVLWANVWQSDRIARIDVESGEVTSWVDLTGLIDVEPDLLAGQPQNVLNGIAWDAENERLFVTGKDWPRLFQIEVDEEPR